MSIFLRKIFKFSVNVFAESSEEGVCSEDIDTGGSIENAGEITVEDSSASFASNAEENTIQDTAEQNQSDENSAEESLAVEIHLAGADPQT